MSAKPFLNIVTVNARSKHTATVIFLHGLGDSGDGWAQALKMMQVKSRALDHVKFICPSAGHRSVTLNYGMQMPAWYDIRSLDKRKHLDDRGGILESCNHIDTLIEQEMTKHSIPSERIVLAGFSQGGSIALCLGLTVTKKKLAGIAGLSTYLSLGQTFEKEATSTNMNTPLVMFHGREDFVVSFDYGLESFEKIKQVRAKNEIKEEQLSQFFAYDDMEHSSCPEEMNDFVQFLQRVIPEQQQ